MRTSDLLNNEHHHLASSSTITTFLAAVLLWVTFPLVTLTAKCLLTARPCTRFSPTKNGADFAHPLTAAALHLLLVGVSLVFVLPLQRRRRRRRRRQQQQQQQDTHYSLSPEDYTTTDSSNNNDTFLTIDKLRICAPVGLAFGTKYVVGHWALQITPTVVYELFHCLNLLFVALFAHFLLGEGLRTWGEVISCVGVVVGSVLAGQKGFEVHGKISILALCLNICNGLLAGMVVVLLRSTMLQCHGKVAQVTALKMLIGASAVLPMAWFIEDGSSIALSLTSKQVVWLLVSSGAILLYHLSLGLLCWLATAPTVAIVEALRPVPAFVAIALLQKMEAKNANFWIGSVIVLASAVTFQLSRKFCRVDFGEETRGEDPTRMNEQRHSTEFTGLLDYCTIGEKEQHCAYASKENKEYSSIP